MKTYVEQHTAFPEELKTAKEKMPVAYFGIGILEWHGEHNVTGLDGVKANGLAIHFAQKFGGVVVPPLFWGDNRCDICELVFKPELISTAKYDHTVPICEKIGYKKEDLEINATRSLYNGGWSLWIELATHIFFQLESFGYKCIVPIPGHYPLFMPLDLAIERYKACGGKCDVFIIKDTMFDDNGNSGDHAAMFETSLMMELYPKYVELQRLDQDRSNDNIGVMGIDPRDNASRQFGQQIIEKFDCLLEEHLKSICLL